MRYLLIVIFSIISYKSTAQAMNYPIQTLFRGDSVVIMSTDQFRSLNDLIEAQKAISSEYRNEIKSIKSVSDSLELIIAEKKRELDSIASFISFTDSISRRLKIMEYWLYTSAVDNSYIYYSWSDSTIKKVDLCSYSVYGNRISGKLSFVRRGPNEELRDWKLCNFKYPQEPDLNWELKYNEDIRPIVTNFPYKFQNRILIP